MKTLNYSKADYWIEKAKKRVVEKSLARNGAIIHLFVERDDEGFQILNNAEYQEFGNEHNCIASVWSYHDGDYDEQNVFVENGRIKAAVERYA